MVSTKELRIGNLILADFNGEGDKKIIEIFQINESGSILSDQLINNKGLGNLQEHWDEYLYGIELTEEWLIRLGFERKSRDNEFVWVTQYYMFLNPDSGWYFRYKFDGFVSFNFGDLFVKDIQFVHQLQNLYFALTGEELNVKTK